MRPGDGLDTRGETTADYAGQCVARRVRMRVLSQDHLEVNVDVDVEVEVEGMVEVVATQTKPSAKVTRDLRLEKRRLPSLGIFVSVCSKV